MNIAINKNASLGMAGNMARHLGGKLQQVNGKHCIVTAPPAANTGPRDEDRLKAIALARQLLPIYVQQHPQDWRLEAALATAIDFGEGRLDVMADPHALGHGRQYARNAVNDTTSGTCRVIANIVQCACEPVVQLAKIEKMSGLVRGCE